MRASFPRHPLRRPPCPSPAAARPARLPLLLGALLALAGAGTAGAATPAPAPAAAPVQAPAALPGSGLRGLWIDAFGPGLKTRAQVARTVEDAARLGVNTLFVQAVRRADCLCRRSSFPVITDADLEAGFDPLAAITSLAHARGMKVIAWVSVSGVSNTAAPNTNPRHLFRTNGPQAGSASWLARRADGSWQEGRDGWVDLGLPEAADYLARGVVSLVQNYPIDGIQLDRIRYPDGGVWGYDPKVLARYRAETGQRGTPAATDARWAEWKRQQVTAFVRRVWLEVKTVRPQAWVSAATITYQAPPAPGDLAAFARTRTYGDVLQDWPGWIRDGWLDLNVPMNYKRDAQPPQAEWFTGWNAFAHSVRTRADGQPTALAAGSALYLNPVAVSAAQISRSTRLGLGWVGYSYRTPTADVYGQRQTTAQGLEALRAGLRPLLGVPAAPWTEAPPVARGLMGRVIVGSAPGSRVVELYRQGQRVGRTLTDGLGYYGFAALPPGPVEVRVSGSRWPDQVPEEGVARLPDLLVRDLAPVPALPPAR